MFFGVVWHQALHLHHLCLQFFSFPPIKKKKKKLPQPQSPRLNMLFEKKKGKARAVADKRRSVFTPLISGNYICWRGGKWSSPGGVLYSTHSMS